MALSPSPKGGKPLTPVEAYTLIGMIYLIRKKRKPYVTVSELSEVIKRSESRVRVILNNLKKKGYVIDEDLRNLIFIKERIESVSPDHLGSERETIHEDLDERFRAPRGGVEKAWMIKGYDVLRDEGLKSFFEDYADALKYLLKVDIEELKNKLLSIRNKQI